MEEFENKAPTEEERADEALLADEQPEQQPYTPRPLGLRILAWVLAVLVIIGLGLYYYHIFIGK